MDIVDLPPLYTRQDAEAFLRRVEGSALYSAYLAEVHKLYPEVANGSKEAHPMSQFSKALKIKAS